MTHDTIMMHIPFDDTVIVWFTYIYINVMFLLSSVIRRNSCFDPREMCLHSYLLVGHNSNSIRVIKTERAILNIKCKVLGNINTASMTVIPSNSIIQHTVTE